MRKDLELKHLVDVPPDEQREAHQQLGKFYDKLAASPQGQETVENLQANIVAYSLHAGRWRSLTWHDVPSAIVWLLAGRYHRSGHSDDSYPHFRGLAKQDLLPTETDYERVFEREGPSFAAAVAADVEKLLDRGRSRRGEIVDGRVFDRPGQGPRQRGRDGRGGRRHASASR